MPRSLRCSAVGLPMVAAVLATWIGCGFTSPKVGSIGARLSQQGSTGRVRVEQVEPHADGRPAELHDGDEILTVDGQDVRDMSVDEIHHAMRGPVGSVVVLQVLREGMVTRIEIARRPLRRPKAGEVSPASSNDAQRENRSE
ncbi:MAG: PDZ domain-containing protein [Polyangiaceae bacterium]